MKQNTTTKKRARITILCILFFLSIHFFFVKPVFSIDDDDEFFENKTIGNISLSKEYDPWEKFNRKIFFFNLIVYDKVLIPLGKWYNNNLPLWFRWSFKNFVQNYTETPKDVVLSVLDFDIEAILASAWRFAINTVFGFFGMDDVAFLVDLNSYKKTMDDILYFYHIPRGPYVVLPLLGPGNLRGTIGSISYTILTSSLWSSSISQDYANIFSYQSTFNPFYIPFHKNGDIIWITTGMWVGDYFDIATTLAGTFSFLGDSAIDLYSNFRTYYFQGLENREKKYMQDRMNGKIKNLNICDYDGMVELPDECFEDPKEYDLIEHSKINNR